MDSARKRAPRYSVNGCYLVQKVRPIAPGRFIVPMRCSYFAKSSVSWEANGSWRCWRTRNVEVICAFGRGRCMPSSASRPPLTWTYLLEEPTLTAVTKLGAPGVTCRKAGARFAGCLRVHKSTAHQPFAGDCVKSSHPCTTSALAPLTTPRHHSRNACRTISCTASRRGQGLSLRRR
jgi:hypothetical protein